MFNVQGLKTAGLANKWKVRLETKGNSADVISDARFTRGHDARGWLLVIREQQLVQIVPDGRLRWVPEVVASSRNRWQSCWDGESQDIVARFVRRCCQPLSKPENKSQFRRYIQFFAASHHIMSIKDKNSISTSLAFALRKVNWNKQTFVMWLISSAWLVIRTRNLQNKIERILRSQEQKRRCRKGRCLFSNLLFEGRISVILHFYNICNNRISIFLLFVCFVSDNKNCWFLISFFFLILQSFRNVTTNYNIMLMGNSDSLYENSLCELSPETLLFLRVRTAYIHFKWLFPLHNYCQSIRPSPRLLVVRHTVLAFLVIT